MIDLYAHRLSGTAGRPAITVKSGAKLTIEGSATDSAVLLAPTPGTPALVIEPGASVAQVIEKADTVLPKLEAPAPAQGGPAQPGPAQQTFAGQLDFLPQTGDDSMLPVFAVGLIGMVVIAVGSVISHRRK